MAFLIYSHRYRSSYRCPSPSGILPDELTSVFLVVKICLFTYSPGTPREPSHKLQWCPLHSSLIQYSSQETQPLSSIKFQYLSSQLSGTAVFGALPPSPAVKKMLPGRNLFLPQKLWSWTAYCLGPVPFASNDLRSFLVIHTRMASPVSLLYHGWKKRLHFNFRWLYQMLSFFS